MSLSEFLKPEAIVLQLEAQTSEEVIRALGTRLFELGCVKDNFVEATLKREAEMPTGLPLGGDVNAAIPHVDLEYVNQPALALATLKNPVVFYNMVENDVEVPAQLIIMLALDQPKSQIEMLQQVAGILQQNSVVAGLMEATTPDEVFTVLASVENV